MNTNIIEVITKLGKLGKSFNVEFANGKMYIVFASEADAEDANISCGTIASYGGYYNSVEINPSSLV